MGRRWRATHPGHASYPVAMTPPSRTSAAGSGAIGAGEQRCPFRCIDGEIGGREFANERRFDGRLPSNADSRQARQRVAQSGQVTCPTPRRCAMRCGRPRAPCRRCFFNLRGQRAARAGRSVGAHVPICCMSCRAAALSCERSGCVSQTFGAGGCPRPWSQHMSSRDSSVGAGVAATTYRGDFEIAARGGVECDEFPRPIPRFSDADMRERSHAVLRPRNRSSAPAAPTQAVAIIDAECGEIKSAEVGFVSARVSRGRIEFPGGQSERVPEWQATAHGGRRAVPSGTSNSAGVDDAPARLAASATMGLPSA